MAKKNTVTSMLELWKHEQYAVEMAKRKKHLALFFDAGTGKTATMIRILRDEYNTSKRIHNTLIFAPLSVVNQWKTEFLRFSKVADGRIYALTGSGRSKTDILTEVNRMSLGNIVITNYEAVQNKKVYEQLLRFNPQILVADESQRLKDSKGVRFKLIFPIAAEAKRRFILTGTPITNSLMDIFGQFKIMDYNIFGANYFYFQTKYFHDKNAGMPKHCHFPDWQPRPEAAGLIANALSQHAVQARKEECIDLPPLHRIPVHVELGADQRKAYDMMKKEYVAEVSGKVITAEFAMTKTLRMQQILAGFIPYEGEEKQETQWCKEIPRLKALEDLLEAIGGQKTIVWTNFKPTYKRIGDLCSSLDLLPEFITGDQSASEKQQALDNFCRGTSNVLIANPAAGGAGINITEAKYAIYYTRNYSLEQFLQSEARNYRAGSTMHSSVTHYHLVATGTLDEVIADALLAKQSVADAVLRWTNGDRSHMFAGKEKL